MNKVLIVIDMQNDFVTGSLANPDAQTIVPNIKVKIETYKRKGHSIIFTRDSHDSEYLSTPEGRRLPVPHCIRGTWGWLVVNELNYPEYKHVNKSTFAYPFWEYEPYYDEIELVGTCTDICVVSNALALKTVFPYATITVDASCCAGTTPENHRAALAVMKSCQIDVIGEEK